MLGVVGGRGGVGASRFAATLAARAAATFGRCLLLDLDPCSGGIDVLLGVESVPGARWSGLRLAGGHLDPALLLDGLPSWGAVSVLAADSLTAPPVESVEQVIEVAAPLAPVVIDLARWPSRERSAAVSRCDLIVLLVTADVPGVTAARCVASELPVPLGLLVRGSRASARAVPDLVGARLLGRLPGLGRRAVGLENAPRRMRLAASGVLDAVEAR